MANKRNGVRMELVIFARFRAQPGREHKLAAAIRDVMPPTCAEPGCLAISAYRSVRDPLLFWIHSHWVDEAAFDRHAERPHARHFIAMAETLIEHPLDITRATVFA